MEKYSFVNSPIILKSDLGHDYIRVKTEEVFYDPKVATKDLVDRVFDIANKRESTIRLLAFAKSAIRHNMAKDLPKMNLPACLIWGKYDKVTPPHVAEEFNTLLPNSSYCSAITDGISADTSNLLRPIPIVGWRRNFKTTVVS